MKLPIALRSEVTTLEAVVESVRAENRELRSALKSANEELRNAKRLLADLRTEPDATLKRIMGDHYGDKR